MARRVDAAAGVFAAGAVLVFVAAVTRKWWLLVPAACLMVGAWVATSRQRPAGRPRNPEK